MNYKMRAVLVKDEKGPIENLYLGEVETPVPKEGEVLIKVRVLDVVIHCADSFTAL